MCTAQIYCGSQMFLINSFTLVLKLVLYRVYNKSISIFVLVLLKKSLLLTLQFLIINFVQCSSHF